MKHYKIQNPAVLIDVSHDNAMVNDQKNYKIQPDNIFSIMRNIQDKPELKNLLKGFMIESFLKEGCQSVNVTNGEEIDMNGLSITDPCIDWETTENCLQELNKRVNDAQ